MKKILSALSMLAMLAGTAYAGSLYTNNFGSAAVEPPESWVLFETSNPADFDGLTITAAELVGYMAITTTTSATDKHALWRYSNGNFWSGVTMTFTIVDVSSNTNVSFYWGLRLPASNSVNANFFEYHQVDGDWLIKPNGFESVDPFFIDELTDGDIITTTIGSGINPLVEIKVNTFVAFSESSTTDSEFGTILLGIGTDQLDFCYAKIDGLIVSGDQVTATPTPTNTPLPTATEIDTSTPLPTLTNTPRPTSTFTKTPTPAKTATQTKTPVPTFTVTKTQTRTPIPTSTPRKVPAMSLPGSGSGW